MKYTVRFFYNCKEYIKKIVVPSIRPIALFISIIFFGIIAGIITIKNDRAINSVMVVATNVRQAEEKNYTIADLLKVYPVFNSNNYVVAKVNKNSSETVEETEKNSTADFDVTAVDTVSNMIILDKSDIKKKESTNYTKVTLYGITVYDYSSMEIDYTELMDMNVNLTKKSDPILFYCTHTSETYANSERFKFQYSGNYRVKEAEFNMISVANVMSKRLKDKGLTTVLDTTPHDYTSYQNAYKNSMKTIEKNLKENPRFGIVIDVHRDAAADLSFAPKVNINGKSTAQLMLVVGVGTKGYENKYWKKNLSLALNIAKLGEEMYPGLFRQILVRDSRYNQHLNEGALLVEVGSTGNTLEEAYYGARCFANILARIYK